MRVNQETAGAGNTAAGIAAMTTQQMTANLPTGFDPATWETVSGETYPYLKWQATRGLSNTYKVSSVSYSINGGTSTSYTGTSATLTNNINDIVTFTVTNNNSNRVYLPYSTDISYTSGTATAPVTLTKANQIVSIGFASESDIIGVKAPSQISSAYGTVFPFVHTEGDLPIEGFDELFSITASLYAVPSSNTIDPIEEILYATPLYTTVVTNYNETVVVAGTPKNPGQLGNVNNPGEPISWAVIGKTHGNVDTTTLRQGEEPSSPIGVYSFDDVVPGDYLLTFSRAGYLTRFAKVTINGNTVLGHRELIPGDVDDNLIINVYDVSLMNSKFSVLGGSKYNARYDFNADGEVNALDVSLVIFYQGFYFEMYSDTFQWLLTY